MRFFYFAQSEGAKPDLDGCTVEKDLVINWLSLYYLLEVGFHHHVTRLAELVVDSEVINKHNCSTDSLSRAAPLMDFLNESVDHLIRIVLQTEHILMLGLGKASSYLFGRFGGLVVQVVQHDD